MENQTDKFADNEPLPQESAEAKSWFEKNRKLLLPRESHYTLPELQELAAARKSWGEFWEMPEHLASCPVCLDCFDTLLNEDTRVDEAVLVKMREIHPLRGFALALMKFEPYRIAKIAAAVAILAFAAWYAVGYFSVPNVRIIDGTLMMSDGRQMTSGSKVPDESELTAAQPTSAVFSDGSKITMAQDTRISLQPARFSNRTVQLSDGNIQCEVAKQKAGHNFRVLTPAGEIKAVGTKFSVDSRSSKNSDSTSRNELKFIHPLEVGARQDSVVTVKVQEGAVLVMSRYGTQSRLTAGQTAVLRSGISVIDVFGGK